jgi:hypothetical protein
MKTVTGMTRGLLAAWTVLALGCASDDSERQMAQIKTVSIDPAVPKPKDIFYEDPTTLGAGMAFGIFGKIARASSVRGQIDRRARGSQIVVERIVCDEFAKALREKAGLAVASTGLGEGRFHLEIVQYGLRMDGMISGSLVPIMTLSAQLRGPDGRVLWEEEGENERDEMPSHSRSEYLDNPKLLEEAFARAAQSASGVLLESFRE